MKKIVCFDRGIYPFFFEKDFFRYCLLRDFSLLRFLPGNFLASILWEFGRLSRPAYLARRWRFLSSMKAEKVRKRAERFAHRYRGRLRDRYGADCVVCAHPEAVIAPMRSGNAEYRFAPSETDGVRAVAEAGDAVFGTPTRAESAELSAAGLNLRHVRGRLAFRKRSSAVVWELVRCVLTLLLLFLAGAVAGLASLWLAKGDLFDYHLFFSYFTEGNLVWMNLLPVIWLVFLLYLLTNRPGVSAACTAALILAMSIGNYYKLDFRMDPFIFEDLTILLEAGQITAARYSLFISTPLVTTVVLTLAGTGLCCIGLHRRIGRPVLRTGLLALTLCVGVFGLLHVWTDPEVYEANQNPEYINEWSATEQFLSRGFIYPFIYSTRSMLSSRPPTGYDKAAARAALAAYEEEDIPEEQKVSVITVMLEAFADLSRLDGMAFEKDPYSDLHALEAESYSGTLISNVFAGNTINTERCVLGGYNTLHEFNRNTNSYAWWFRSQGYTTQGSHAGYLWFYNRWNVDSHLGLRNLYFAENHYTALAGQEIAPDAVLLPEIAHLWQSSVRETGAPVFSFNVTYQNHGPYPATPTTSETWFSRSAGLSEEYYNYINNYLDGVADTGCRLRELTDTLAAAEEPAVLIVFGDHLPWMGNANCVYDALGVNFDLETKEGFFNYYGTPYLIWANPAAKHALGCDFIGEGPAISPMFLYSELFRLTGWKGTGYMQLLGDLKQVLPIVHTTTYSYCQGGEMKRAPEGEAAELYRTFTFAQYYERKNFRYR